ncbi:MAG: helix-turn-helix transcriptional regulator [Sphingomonadaceae bacterium]
MTTENIPALPTFVDLQTVRNATSLSRSAIYRLFETGELTRCKIGKKVVVQESELRSFVAKIAQSGGNTNPTAV